MPFYAQSLLVLEVSVLGTTREWCVLCFCSESVLVSQGTQIANVLVMKDFLARWPITPLQEGAISSVLYHSSLLFVYWHSTLAAVLELGALIGALFAGIFADRYSRRQAIFAACCTRHISIIPKSHVNEAQWSSVLAHYFNVQRRLLPIFSLVEL